MIEEDLQELYKSSYNRKQLCWIILKCLDIINELNLRQENDLK